MSGSLRRGGRAVGLALTIFAMVALVFGGPVRVAFAQSASQNGIIGTDDRVPVSETDERWLSIGQVNIGGYRSRGICSGTLISPRIVLTAAHCVFDVARQRPLLIRNIHFAAGVHRDRVVDRATAQCLLFAPGFDPQKVGRLLPDIGVVHVPFESFKSDLALIVLNRTLSDLTPFPLAKPGALTPASDLTLAGYPIDRRHILTLQEGCHVLHDMQGVALIDCDAKQGTSGAPVLVKVGDSLTVAGVLTGTLSSGEANVMTPVANWPELPLDASCPVE